MISRRKFVTGSLAALALPAAAATLVTEERGQRVRLRPAASADTASTLAIGLVNNTGNDTVYAYVTGQAIDNNNALMLLEADGQTPYYPSSPSSTNQPVPVNCAIGLNASGGAARSITIPHLAGARIWFSIGSPLTFQLNPGPALVEPSVTNPSDPNVDLQWDFAELTYNSAQLFANISMVDFVCIPIGLSLTDSSGGQQTAEGLPGGGLDTVCSGLSAQTSADGQGWDQLIVTNGGQNLRALSPTNGIVMNSALFSGYYDSYVNQVWSMYSSATLSVDTQASFGTVTGQVSGGALTFSGVGSFGPPAAADIFGCNSGPFSPAGMSAEMLAILPRLAAAFNRSTLLIDSSQPDGENPSDYYSNAITNHYARIVHATSQDHRGYAFPYDDVAPTGGTDQSGAVSSGSPSLLTVTLGSVH
ncbi:MAG TPA: glycoside hydrolase family 64 protein [Streptosporangiaceae bacterium]|nr:glycoside hydrolase family 64 protein [Streptosporangiaceae bacterium]